MIMIFTFALQRFLDIQNAPSPGLCIQTALQHYVLSLICMNSFQFPLLLVFQREINDSSSAESIDYSQTSKISASIASVLSDKEPHSTQAADVSQPINQNDLNDLGSGLGLTKKKLELLSSRLKH